jgi:hypothetical protein
MIPARLQGPLWICVLKVPAIAEDVPLTEKVVVDAFVFNWPLNLLPATVPVNVTIPLLHEIVPAGALLWAEVAFTVLSVWLKVTRKESKEIDLLKEWGLIFQVPFKLTVDPLELEPLHPEIANTPSSKPLQTDFFIWYLKLFAMSEAIFFAS